MSNISFPCLSAPLELPFTQLPNRLVMGAMHTGFEELNDDFRHLAAFYQHRAQGGVGLIITGGFAPNWQGRLRATTCQFSQQQQIGKHRRVTDTVHQLGTKICLQILHAGRYAYHPFCVAPSAIGAPINPFTPVMMTAVDIEHTLNAFAHTAELAQRAGYDGVEIMGSEGYLINEFLSPVTNQRTDQWGGNQEGRHRFALAVVKRIRERVGDAFLIIFRLSLMDLVPSSSSGDESLALGRELGTAGVDLLNTGIGWHESRVPTIASSVPRAAFSWATAMLRQQVDIPVIAANRFNDPVVAERVLAEQQADMISMARPLLADAELFNKAVQGRPASINTCIACNQACLDHAFVGKRVSCLVNPIAGYETELQVTPSSRPLRIAVVGAGPAGLACACTAAERGHQVVLFERDEEIGGQFNYARQIPGKAEFAETLRYFRQRLAASGAVCCLGINVDVARLKSGRFDAVVLATGVKPRLPDIPGIDHPSVLSYLDVLREHRAVGERVAIIGAGGIGFDVATYLLHSSGRVDDVSQWLAHWSIDPQLHHPGGLLADNPGASVPRRLTLLQRSSGILGRQLGKTTGWIHRLELKRGGVQMLSDVHYQRIDDAGLHIERAGQSQLIPVDNIVVCSGQLAEQSLLTPLMDAGLSVHVIGGAERASGLDAKRAIRQGTELACRL